MWNLFLNLVKLVLFSFIYCLKALSVGYASGYMIEFREQG